jgi:hypothetical protein
VLLKSIEAPHDEMLLAARRYGVADGVLASASKTLACPWMDMVHSLSAIGRHPSGAEEVGTSAVAVRDAGIEPTMAEAVARRLRWKANLEPKDHFDGIVPETIEDTLDAMERKMAKDA